jgi:hypothetical protein
MFAPTQNTFGATIDDLKKTVKAYLVQAEAYESMSQLYRILGVAIYGIPVLFAFIGLATRSPRVMKGYYIFTLAQIVAAYRTIYYFTFLPLSSCY